MNSILRLLCYAKKHPVMTGMAYLCLLLSTAAGLAFPWLTKDVIDEALAGRASSVILTAAMITVGVSVAKAAFSFGQAYLNESLAQLIAYDLRTALYDRVQRLSFSFHDSAQTGDLMSRATSDVGSVFLFFNLGLLCGIKAALIFVFAAAVMITIDWHLALMSIAVVPLLSLRAISVSRRLRNLYLAVQRQFARLSTVLQESIAGVRVVKAFAREEYEIDKFGSANRKLMADQMATVRQGAVNFPFMSFIVTTAVAVILWYGGREVMAGNLSIGGLVAFNGYLMMLSWPARDLGWILNLTARAGSCGDRIFEILDAPCDVVESPDALELPRLKGIIRFNNVSFGYGSQHPILEDISFQAQPGQTVALVGRTGSGKSTVINLIPRFYDPTKGHITVDGLDIRMAGVRSLRQQIGIVLQESFLFSASVRDNIAYGIENASQSAVEQAARAAHAHDFIVNLPDGYATVIGERGMTLSGGQRQRIALARTLLLDPPILLLDDSTSSLDTETEYLIQEALHHLSKDRTTLVIAQRIATVKRANHILVIENGRIAEQGTHEELMERGPIYQEIYNVHLRELDEPSRTAGSVGRG